MNRVFPYTINKPPNFHIDYFGMFLFHSVAKENMSYAALYVDHERMFIALPKKQWVVLFHLRVMNKWKL